LLNRLSIVKPAAYAFIIISAAQGLGVWLYTTGVFGAGFGTGVGIGVGVGFGVGAGIGFGTGAGVGVGVGVGGATVAAETTSGPSPKLGLAALMLLSKILLPEPMLSATLFNAEPIPLNGIRVNVIIVATAIAINFFILIFNSSIIINKIKSKVVNLI
jgi:hypothetical protein